MEFNQEKPIYRQITDWMSDKILRREWCAGDRIPSVRDVAAKLQVNPNTAMRAYEGLQGEGIIYNKRGIGYFVSEDACAKIVESEKAEFLTEILPGIFSRLELLGLNADDLYKEYEKFKSSK